MSLPRSFAWLGFLFFFDRLFKQFFLISSLTMSGGDFFYLIASVNRQGPFSLPLPNIFLIVLSALVLAGLLLWLISSINKMNQLAFLSVGLIVIGGFSNLLDRINIGGVIDVVEFTWPAYITFNLADIYLLIGWCWLIWLQRQPRGALQVK